MSDHEDRIHRVCDYIAHHLDTDLRLETLADVAALSRFHFHRVFAAYTGLSLGRFIQLARLKRASYQLAFDSDLKIIDIALNARFESPEAFARAFKRQFGQTPSAFRKQPDWPLWQSNVTVTLPKGSPTMDVNIIDFPETKIAFFSHRGPVERVNESAGKFIAWRKDTGLSPVKTSKTFGIPYSDPNTTAPEDFRFDICGAVTAIVPDNAHGVQNGVIPGGRCAVVRHFGSHDTMEPAIYHLYRDWLPHSGETWRDFPCFFHYVNLIPEVEEHELITDIHLPIL